MRRGVAPNRVPMTVLPTDTVASTDSAARLRSQRWREPPNHYAAMAGAEVERFRGRLIKTTCDGALASFDRPARAIRCARTPRDSASQQSGSIPRKRKRGRAVRIAATRWPDRGQ
jgi:class 3 adenylate cyclase